MAPSTTVQRRLNFEQDEAQAEAPVADEVANAQIATVDTPMDELAAPGDTSGLTAEDLAVVAQIRERSAQVREVQRREGTLPPQPKRFELSPDNADAFAEALLDRMQGYDLTK